MEIMVSRMSSMSLPCSETVCRRGSMLAMEVCRSVTTVEREWKLLVKPWSAVCMSGTPEIKLMIWVNCSLSDLSLVGIDEIGDQ
eukprot:6225970-Heterocapsa_arctica.AAC.1